MVLAALVSSVASDARADDVEAARKDFAEGVRLYQRGDYEGARRLFKKADTEHHAAPVLYNLARTEERLLRAQAAVDAYEAYVGDAGEGGEFTGAAVVAITQIKARSTRLRIETRPTGARIFVDGFPLSESSPTTFLVSAGHHVVVAQGEAFRAERDVEVTGNGDSLSVTLEAPLSDASAPLSPPDTHDADSSPPVATAVADPPSLPPPPPASCGAQPSRLRPITSSAPPLRSPTPNPRRRSWPARSSRRGTP